MKAAIQELMDDHTVILRMLGVLEGMCRRLSDGGRVESVDLDSALDFIAIYADQTHHGKEEDYLFTAMERAGFPRDGGPVGMMLIEHRQGREFVQALRLAAKGLKEGSPSAAEDAMSAASGYAQLLAHHIFKENNILYPMALNAIPKEDWETMTRDFARVEAERMGPVKRAGYEALVARLETVYPPLEKGRNVARQSGACPPR
ncbi:MAG: hemerythrin domain-containing protein [Elusimicrobia bacterium]|nr:hemerythrin domain-containing protein [Elusimicrobiota bacterium]